MLSMQGCRHLQGGCQVLQRDLYGSVSVEAEKATLTTQRGGELAKVVEAFLAFPFSL